MSDFDCMDCGVDTKEIDEYYTVDHDLWESVVPDVVGMLCIGCLEARLGRVLTAADFPRYAINLGFFNQSERLSNRLGRN